MSKGFFLVIEGGEGSGKTTMAQELKLELRQAFPVPVVATREPGGTPMAERIRGLLLEHHDEPVCEITELLLFNASRRQHYVNVIKPQMDRGAIVLSERFSDSSYALQCRAGNLALEDFNRVVDTTLRGFKPNLTVVLDVDPAFAFERLEYRGRLDRMESKGLAFHQNVRKAFLECARAEPERYLVLEALQDLHGMVNAIIDAVRVRLT